MNCICHLHNGVPLPLILENLEIHRSLGHPNKFTKINTNRIKLKCMHQFKESCFHIMRLLHGYLILSAKIVELKRNKYKIYVISL